MGSCPNCKAPWSKERSVNLKDGRVGVEKYCATCPPEKWSQFTVEVTPELNAALNEFWKTSKRGAR